MSEPAHRRQLTSTVYATPLMTPTTALGLSIRLSMFELRETGDWDIFLGPPEPARAETGGADQRVLKRRECSGFARVNKLTSASLGNLLSVFNKNSVLRSVTKSDLFCQTRTSGPRYPPKLSKDQNLEVRGEDFPRPRQHYLAN